MMLGNLLRIPLLPLPLPCACAFATCFFSIALFSSSLVVSSLWSEVALFVLDLEVDGTSGESPIGSSADPQAVYSVFRKLSKGVSKNQGRDVEEEKTNFGFRKSRGAASVEKQTSSRWKTIVAVRKKESDQLSGTRVRGLPDNNVSHEIAKKLRFRAFRTLRLLTTIASTLQACPRLIKFLLTLLLPAPSPSSILKNGTSLQFSPFNPCSLSDSFAV